MIGLKRGRVKLSRYSTEWRKLFEQEKRRLKRNFKNVIIAVEHIGSTAVPGVPAKAIIDMNIGVKSLAIARRMKEQFEKLGYEHRAFISGRTPEGLRRQVLFCKNSGGRCTHHVHVTKYGNDYWQEGILFRDYLKRHPAVAREYARLKKRLAEKYPGDRERYTNCKDRFIKQILKLAETK